MKLIKIFRRFKPPFLTLIQNNIYLRTLLSLIIILFLSAIIWEIGPYIAWNDYFPLAEKQKRFYIISILFLVWLLKFLMIDLDAPNPYQYKDEAIQKKLLELLQRFQGAKQFLNKTKVAGPTRSIKLSQLPLYLVVGPKGAGKTTSLFNSGAHYILHRQFTHCDPSSIKASEICDWWLTRDVDLIDVPGHYLQAQPVVKTKQEKPTLLPIYWRFFLQLIKKIYGKNRISGIIIVLPLVELMHSDPLKKLQGLTNEMVARLREINKTFKGTLPCYFLLTKCDLLPGFVEFFSEMSNEDIMQYWGVSLFETTPTSIQKEVSSGFDALIKKLNQQLLWRLHHERDQNNRPLIKDFPFQIERLKETTLSFIKKFAAANLNLAVKGIYLSSACQKIEAKVIAEKKDTKALRLLKQPQKKSRSFFIKGFLTKALLENQALTQKTNEKLQWYKPFAFTCSAIFIAMAVLFLGKDFKHGVNHANTVQNQLVEYQAIIQPIQNPDEHLATTLAFLNTLHKTTKQSEFKIDLAHLLSFYSHQSQQKTNEVYQQALTSVLLPEVQSYLTEYLKKPVNKNAETLYSVFKTYLMLGDKNKFEPTYVINTLVKILPNNFRNRTDEFREHLNFAFKNNWQALRLDGNLTNDIRKYFMALPKADLGYIILKNVNNNQEETEINLFTNKTYASFTLPKIAIPTMYTSAVFNTILSTQTRIAAEEAFNGNWVLGYTNVPNGAELINNLTQEIRSNYVVNYVGTWEKILNTIDLTTPKNLSEIDNMVVDLISTDSPLLKLLKLFHDNTFFEPIASNSVTLAQIGSLLDKKATDTSQQQLYQIFAGLQALHMHIQSIITASDEKKAAFSAVNTRLKNNKPDAITQVKIIADQSPEPLRLWLQKIANHTLKFLMLEAGNYIDLSWQEEVAKPYLAFIAGRYPFNSKTTEEVALAKFAEFFGNPGIVFNFYQNYLEAFVDTNTPDWRFKEIDNTKLPFNEDSLRQIQHALRIHKAFFPNNDDKLNLQFALQLFKIGKNIKSITLNINDRAFTDDGTKTKESHVIAWPSNATINMTTVQLRLKNNKVIKQEYPGNWGWFKLVNHGIDSVINKKQLLIDVSWNEQLAKYFLYVDEQHNPFVSLNLKHFTFPSHLLSNS